MLLSEKIERVAAALENRDTILSPEGAVFLAEQMRRLQVDAVDLERTLRFKRMMGRVAPPPLKLPANVVRLSVVR